MRGKGNFHNEKMETASLKVIKELQGRRLKEISKHVYSSNAIYRRLFDDHGVAPEDIKTVEDITKLPLTSKDLLRESYPLGLACVDRKKIVEMHMSSGSTGTPVVMPYTQGDLDQWAECMARCYRMAGAVPGDAAQITPLFGLFHRAGQMYHGAPGAAGLFGVIPAGPGTPPARSTRQDFKNPGDHRRRQLRIRLMEVMEEMNESLLTPSGSSAPRSSATP